ncbi:MAG: DUF3021 domain-containing protein [Clostridia bacterium]|nr:DUF3021 domain-containing protein [Clostridia bacterium]
MKILKKYFKDFFLRGLVSMGFGPIVLSIVYGILDICGVVEKLAVYEVVLGFLSITALAFLCGGMTVVYQIEEIGLSKAITLHGVALYVAYAVVYLSNNWLKDGIIPFVIFTIIFVVGYALVWLVIYFITKRGTDSINKRIIT